jgi:sialate O-acetylesterase
MPEDKLEKFVRDATEKFERDRREYTARFRTAGAAAKEKCAGWSAPEADDAGWRKFSADRPKGSTVRWFRLRFTIPETMRGRPLLFMMNKCADSAEIYFNGEKVAAWDPWDPAKKQQLGLMLRPAKQPADGRCVLTVRAEYLDTLTMPRLQKAVELTTRIALGKERLYLKMGWLQRDEFVASDLGRAPRLVLPSQDSNFPGNLYNGMIAAWTRFPVRGILWYQGCANAGKPEYYVLQKALIADWRKQWGDAELPFIITQLAGFDVRHKDTWRTADPNQPFAFAVTRDIQHQVSRELKGVGLVTAVDLGDVDNIHPGTKRELGRRYMLEALRIAYGQKIVSQGPTFVSATPEGKTIRVRFANAEGGLVTADGKAPGAFAVAGSDGNFVWADRAEIDGETVVVSSAAVPEPKFVRYAYAGFRGDCNLRNKAGLPALPFRSDAIDYSKPIK